ncbi:MAG TPA: DNA polymerase III subunit delta' [Steroidobacteraceae bacterium]|nr:DNA polymerase III subunit delta' [Steroidobacteraceae bacterium]
MTETSALGSLPWHEDAWRQLQSAWNERRWPHGLLVHGPEGVGTHAMALRIAAGLLCENHEGRLDACGECGACKLRIAGTHPDWLAISPEEDKQQISVDQIREAATKLTMTSYRQGYKVTVIQPAHQMTMAAANSLLKTLEEPTPRTALILVTSRLGALLPTLRSRCQQLKIAAPSTHLAQSWLASQGKTVSDRLLRFCSGAPLRALSLADGSFDTLWSGVEQDIAAFLGGNEDVTHIAKRWANEQLPDRLACVDYLIAEKLRNTVVGTDDRITRTPLPSAVSQLNISRMFACLDRVRALQAQLTRTALQRELAVDALLVELHEAFANRSS